MFNPTRLEVHNTCLHLQSDLFMGVGELALGPARNSEGRRYWVFSRHKDEVSTNRIATRYMDTNPSVLR